ncbi:MAG: hypothetical protein LBC61_01895 [Candidatus Peribacteria bacterium]|nr:hypothetical protein [Candidatus Peribacteria bacterium]
MATDTEDEFLVNLETITSGMNEKNSSSSTSGGSSSSSDKDNSTNKNCTVNIYKVENAYNTSPLVFTFYSANAPINGKYLIELDSQGNLVVENNKKENLYFADKNIANST